MGDARPPRKSSRGVLDRGAAPADDDPVQDRSRLLARVLVGLDADGRAQPACERAREFATQHGSTLEFVHAAAVAPIGWIDVEGGPGSALEAVESLDELHGRLRARLPVLDDGTQPHLRVVRGDPAHVIAAETAAFAASLVVLGSHRPRALVDVASTVLGVLAQSAAPVWVQSSAPRAVERVVAAVDLSARGRRVLELARDAGIAFGARVEAVHVFDPRDVVPAGGADEGALASRDFDGLRAARLDELRRELDELDRRGLAISAALDDGTPATALAARLGPADLLVLGTHGRRPLAAALAGSTARAVLRSVSSPLLLQRV